VSRPVAVERPTAAPRRTLGLRPSTPADRTTRWPCPAELQIEARRTVPPADGDAVGVRDCSGGTITPGLGRVTITVDEGR
jgi:hypothetical protein